MSDNPNHAHRWAILAVLGIAQLMVVLDATIVNIALPSAQKSLNFSNDDRQWIITAYSLTFGSLLLLGGKLSDLFGRKRMLLIGLVGFAIASAVGGAAQSFIMLAAARAVQGAFGALLAPAALSLVTTTFTESSERNKAFGIFGAIAGSGASVGLLLGGVLTQTLTWRYAMYVNCGFAIVAIAGAITLLHDVPQNAKEKIDLPGTLAVSIGLFAVVFGLNRAQVDGWTAVTTLVSLAVGIALLATFVMIEFRVTHPLLPMRVPANRNRGASFIAMLLAGAALFGVFLFLTYYLQQNRGYSPIKTGLAFLPMTGAILITSPIVSTFLLRRVGPRVLVSVGMLLSAVGMAIFTRIGLHTSYLYPVVVAEVVLGIGLGFVFSTAFNAATLGVEPHDSGVASALVNACQQVGGAVGVALLSTIAASATSTFATGHHGAAALASRASIHGYTVAFWVAAALFAAGTVSSLLLYEHDARVVPEDAAAPVLAH